MWEAKKAYIFRGVPNEIAVLQNPNTGNLYVEAAFVCVLGSEHGMRLTWRGHLNSEENIDKTRAALKAMGCRSGTLDDWAGFGTVEFEATAMQDDGDDGQKYWNAAFVRSRRTVRRVTRDGKDLSAPKAAIADLNRRYFTARAPANGAPSTRSAEPPADYYDDPQRPLDPDAGP